MTAFKSFIGGRQDEGCAFTNSGEGSTFLALATKRTHLPAADKTSTEKSRTSHALLGNILPSTAFSKVTRPSTGSQQPEKPDVFDFKRLLLPVILAGNRACEANDADYITEDQVSQTAPSTGPAGGKRVPVSRQYAIGPPDGYNTALTRLPAGTLRNSGVPTVEITDCESDRDASKNDDAITKPCIPGFLHIPDDCQWQASDHLRIHAGAPERSENGIKKVLL